MSEFFNSVANAASNDTTAKYVAALLLIGILAVAQLYILCRPSDPTHKKTWGICGFLFIVAFILGLCAMNRLGSAPSATGKNGSGVRAAPTKPAP